MVFKDPFQAFHDFVISQGLGVGNVSLPFG